MKIDLFGISLTSLSQYISVLSIMFNGTNTQGNSAPGLTRHLFFVSKDPIGWRIQILFFIIETGYEQAYYLYMLALHKERNRPVKTGGVKERPKANSEIVVNGEKLTMDPSELPQGAGDDYPVVERGKVVPMYPNGIPE